MAHIYHLYENYLLTFGEIKNILSQTFSGKLNVYEKTDGQNMLLSYSIKKKKAICARSKKDITDGGLEVEQLVDRFYGEVKKTFLEAVKDWERAISLISDSTKHTLFGYDADVFYNCEIQNPINKNVINYDRKYIVVHPNGHVELDKFTREQIKKDYSNNIEILRNALETIESKNTGYNYKLVTKTIYDLKKKIDDKLLKKATDSINDILNHYDLKDSNNIYDLCLIKVNDIIKESAPNLDHHIRKEIVKKIVGIPNELDFKVILKYLNKLEKERIKNLISNSDSIMKNCIEELEEIIHEFSVGLLSGLKSLYILDNDAEIIRLKKTLSDSIEKIEKSNDYKSINVLYKQLKKLKDVGRIDTAIEGLVFDYNGKTYKFTGNFAPINQILGLLTYGKINFDRKVEFSKNENIVIFPGKFKPPHLGHFMGVKELAEIKNINKIIVIISPKENDGVTAQMSKKIWEIFQKYEPKIEIKISESESPIQSTFEYLKTVDSKTKVFLTLSKKELETSSDRYKDVMKFVDKYNPGLSVEVIYTEQNKEGITGSYVRKLIRDSNKEVFFSVLPKEVSKEDKETIWQIVKNRDLFVTKDEIKDIVKEAILPIIIRR